MSKNKFEIEVIDMPHEIVEAHLNLVQGKVLTLVDALFPEGAQNKSVKDTIKSFFRSELQEVWRYCHPKIKPLTEAEMERLEPSDDVDEVEVVEVPLKE